LKGKNLVLEFWILPKRAEPPGHIGHTLAKAQGMTKQPVVRLVLLANAKAAKRGSVGEGLARASDTSHCNIIATFS